jgi:hypothetical protein
LTLKNYSSVDGQYYCKTHYHVIANQNTKFKKTKDSEGSERKNSDPILPSSFLTSNIEEFSRLEKLEKLGIFTEEEIEKKKKDFVIFGTETKRLRELIDEFKT